MSKIPTIAMIPSGYKANKLYSVLPTNGDGDLTTSRASTATRVNKNGLIETVASNIPRLDYSDGGCPSLLLEPQSTNLITYSKDLIPYFSLDPDITIVNNYTISPNGGLNASQLNFNASSRSMFRSAMGLVGTHTISFYVKAEGVNIGKTFDLRLDQNMGGVLNYDIPLTDEWVRHSYQVNGLNTLEFTNRSATTIDTGSMLLWGAQLEALPYATSYIPTNGSTVTREAETSSKSGLSDYINSSEGVLYAEISALNDDTTPVFVSLSDDSTNNRFSIYFQDTRIRAFTIQNNSSAISFSNTTVNVSEFHKIALSYTNDNAKLFIDGSLIDTIDLTSVAFSANLSAVRFDNGGGGSNFYGKVKDLRVYNEALTDTELIALTQV